MRPTIKDVARLAGVSPATVSHALSGKRAVSTATVARVQDAIAELDYRPSQIASSMVTGRTSTIGLIVPDISNPFFGQLVAAIEQAAGSRGFAVFVASSELDPELEASHVEALVDRQVDALIYAGGTPKPNPAILNGTGNLPPFVFIDEIFDWIPDISASVCVDNAQGGYIAAEHLYTLGHRVILVITGPAGLPTACSRTESFRNALKARGHRSLDKTERSNIEIEIVHAEAYTLEAGYKSAKRLLTGVGAGRWRSRPTAMYCTNDLLACGALQAAQELDLRVPEELSVLSFDDTFVCRLTTPTLTSISQPLGEMGRRAADTAIAAVVASEQSDTDETRDSRYVQNHRRFERIPVSLAVRESTSAALGK